MAEQAYAFELQHPAFPFPSAEWQEIDPESIYVSGFPFWQEHQFFREGAGVMPWKEDKAKACRKLAKQASSVAEVIQAAFEAKEKPDSITVRDGLGLFLSILFWSNGRPVQLRELDKQIATLEIKPMNIEERLTYILENGHTYPGFKQWEELLLEQRKLIAKQ